MKYLFVLGRNPELSELELKYYFAPKILKRENEILILESNKIPNIDELGGTVKIAKIISESEDPDEMEYDLNNTNIFTGKSNKPKFYITDYNCPYFQDVEELIKSYFKSQRFKASYKKSKSKQKNTSPTELLKNNFPDNCIEFITYNNILAQTIQVTNPSLLEERDEKRPCPDFLQTISIRLAKILINLTGIKPSQTLLDPFCGTGTILQEALLKKINVIGTDKEEKMIEKSERNLKWLIKTYKVNSSYKLHVSLCKDLSQVIPKDSIDAVATEPFLGPYFANQPSDDQAKKTVNYLTMIYSALFLELNKIMKKNKRCVMVFPTFITKTNKKYYLDIDKILANNFRVIAPITYLRPGKMVILREIKILEKIA